MAITLPDWLLEYGYSLLDRGLVPDFVLRLTIRTLLRQRLGEIEHGSAAANHEAKMKFIEGVKAMDTIAIETKKANEQHYEVPTEFILTTLGPCAKYSSCLYPTGRETLAEAELAMLESYCVKAQLVDGMEILDLGCGWGSLSLFLAGKYPKSKITGLSNSNTQREYIMKTAKERGYDNLQILTGDVNVFDFPEGKTFDRIISIEMFEHMKNYEALMRKVSRWLHKERGLFFTHCFVNRTTAYHFIEDDGWMAKQFFSGGTMMSFDLLTYFQSDLTLERSWYVSGTHYSKTCEHWIQTQDAHKAAGIKHLREDAAAKGLDPDEAEKTFYRFRVFYMACSELFRFDGGDVWGVGHYLFRPKARE
ncbi:S-adenosyl-L-methionine-dependent methyltransferase [Auriculariales sp. MPI-PUGE-AT-0066]|nr:S-adenosyl-L-methionine-dependent methyltransferase [Auriculariales sp. MPI-PUGE-AT-0066]